MDFINRFKFNLDDYRIYDNDLGIHILENIPERLGDKIARALNVAYNQGLEDA